MAVNLRLRADQQEAIRRAAEREGVSQHAVLLRAVDEYLARQALEVKVKATAKEQVAKWAELLERLK
ncbi:CopG family transcriptional regulator [Streptomyces beihaiensis]|uniref:CopG family transcriptional regulator n=1 Tax=Streptomyces beihaiensis TaxID=2984495 RepID=A0ABT3U3A8_9ACTN|nr:CopG family transcriptional regulator [Streptomyces beihaiensis]MCX3063525.1 CopG family transcriptional regulator [Streptomyces beihaiensis]